MSNLVNVYKTSIRNSRFIFKDGTVATFVGDEYVTGEPEKIAELTAEIAAKHPNISLSKHQVSEETLDPMFEYKAKVIAEYLAKVAAASGNPQRDMGATKQEQLNPANSQNIAPLAAGGAGVSAFNFPPNLAKAMGIPIPPNAENVQTVEVPATEVAGDVSDGLSALSVFATK